MKKLAIVLLAAFTGAASVVPLQAAPIAPSKPVSAESNVELVRDRPGWHRGHRGYRHSRPGYRRHSDGLWYPLAAFTAGAIIGGAIANQPRVIVREGGSRHVRWCLNRYASYNPRTNTFLAYDGYRKQCISPYSR